MQGTFTKKVPLLYVSGEESMHQIKMRADRLGDFTDSLELLCETSLDIAKDVIQRKTGGCCNRFHPDYVQ